MRTETTHHVDASEADEKGRYEWRYEYDLHRFIDEDRTLVARSYPDSTKTAQFLRFEVQGTSMAVTQEHISDRLLQQAAAHLRNLGKTEIQYLGPEGYAPLRTEA